jgi:hypothetical protein
VGRGEKGKGSGEVGKETRMETEREKERACLQEYLLLPQPWAISGR